MENLPSTIAKMYKLKFYNATEQIASNLNHAESQATRHPGGERFELVFSKVVPNYNNDTLDHAKEGGERFRWTKSLAATFTAWHTWTTWPGAPRRINTRCTCAGSAVARQGNAALWLLLPPTPGALLASASSSLFITTSSSRTASSELSYCWVCRFPGRTAPPRASRQTEHWAEQRRTDEPQLHARKP